MDKSSPPLLRTRERDCREPPVSLRGARHWSHAETPGDLLFILECGIEVLGKGIEVQRFVMADFWQARELYLRTTYEWSRLLIYVRAPSTFPDGHTFDTVLEVSRCGSDGGLLVRLKSGLMLMIQAGVVQQTRLIEIGKTVFP